MVFSIVIGVEEASDHKILRGKKRFGIVETKRRGRCHILCNAKYEDTVDQSAASIDWGPHSSGTFAAVGVVGHRRATSGCEA